MSEDSYQKKNYKKEDTKPVADVAQSYGSFSEYDKTLAPDQQATNFLNTLLENHTNTDIADAIREFLPTVFMDVETRSKDKLRILIEAIVNMVGIEAFKTAVRNNTDVSGALKEVSSRISGKEVVWAGSDVSAVSHVHIKAPLSLLTENDKTTINIRGTGTIHILSKNAIIPKAQFDVKLGDIVTIKDGKEVLMVITGTQLSQYQTTIATMSSPYQTTIAENPNITPSTYTKST